MIVEDEDTTRAHLISRAKKINPEIDIISTGSAEEALTIAKKKQISAFFIDIKLIDYNGIELAKQLRQIRRYYFTPIVFITAMVTKELEAFKNVHCYDFIIKPFGQKKLEEVFKKILIDYCSHDFKVDKPKLSLTFKDHTQLIDEAEIIYIEYLERKIVIYTLYQNIKYIHIPLKTFKKNLSNQFMQVHQSIIVNKNYIESISLKNQQIKLKAANKHIPIGRSYLKRLGEYLNEHI
ncbi:LytR/AlgR family response regulator transcription factor [Candidatus Contubernalis alkaliaceticus]|uniref:LytR/AlgR family response regulator transcription factor n=1 Tax=Candidatus Contubernalis alkaliaceticus TaxID=338645 RepID=UPI001F4BDA81|nr:LytTR family DNA-binding domain-containing protein [Candidatus Contubernalis alkalaceticus]UNC92579.1 response regulator transcription factor [Candidatus Contubernalis alkalaceticus]